MQRQLPGDMSVGVTYMGSTGPSPDLGRHRGQHGQHQPARSEIPGAQQRQRHQRHDADGAEPVLRRSPNAGAFATRATLQRNQLLRPFPQFDNVNMTHSTLARSQYDAGVISISKRATGWWGGRFSYTYSRLCDNQFGQGNYYSSSPGHPQPPTPLIRGPSISIPMPSTAAACSTRRTSWWPARSSGCRSAPDSRWLTSGVGQLRSLGDWTVALVIQMQSGFPIGVSQNTNNTNLLGAGQRPNIGARAARCGSPAASPIG